MFWFFGGLIGLLLGFVVVCLVEIAYEKKGQHAKLKKIKGSLRIKIILICGIVGLLTLGYCGRTQLIRGDFSDKACDFRYCDNPSICKFYYNFNGGDYYCEKHISFCNRLAGNNKLTSSNDNFEDSYGHDKFDVWVVAEDIVESKLKSPSTAKFCSISEASINERDNTWTIKGYVDAQNSFGATLRSNFTVKITFTSSARYTVDYCEID